MPGTGGTFTDAVPVPSTDTAQEARPLTSSPSSRGRSSGGALWRRAGYTPGDRRTSWVYSSTCVQYLYISCYLSDNKPVLSYLLVRLLPHGYVCTWKYIIVDRQVETLKCKSLGV